MVTKHKMWVRNEKKSRAFRTCLNLNNHQFYTSSRYSNRRRWWHPTPVLLPGNPRDGGAWWAAVYGVAESQTRLKRLSRYSNRSICMNSIKTYNRYTITKKKGIQRYLILCLSLNHIEETKTREIETENRNVVQCWWVRLLSHVWLFATTWIVACQAPPSMEFSWQGYWSRLPFPSPEDLPNPGI